MKKNISFEINFILLQRQIYGGEMRGASPSFFCNHFQELQIVLPEVELINNNAPLINVYSNVIKTCLTPNYLLFSRQLLYSFNAASTVVRNLTVLSSTKFR